MDTEDVKVLKKLLIEISSHLKDLTLFDNLSNRNWLSTEQAAEYLSISKGELLNKCSLGKITYFKCGRKNLFRREILDQFVLQNKRGPQ